MKNISFNFILCTAVIVCCSTPSVFLLVQCNEKCENYRWNPLLKTNRSHIAALILARGGSKGIPLKNLALIHNVTLLSNTLSIIKRNNDFDSIWVSTENELIARDAEKENVLIHWRDPYTATDTASSILTTQEFIQHHKQIDVIALIQCTSPFLQEKYLKKAINYFRLQSIENHSPQCVFSATRSFKLRWEKVNNTVKPLNFDPANRPRRQDWTGEFIENGMFYFATRKLINSNIFQNNKCEIVEIDQIDSYEIDSPWDLIIANKIYQLRYSVVSPFYREVYEILSPNGNYVDPELFKLLLTQANLPQHFHKQIWNLCVTPGSTINRTCVYKALAYIAVAQNGKTPSETLLENYGNNELPTPNIGDLAILKNFHKIKAAVKLTNGLSLNYEDIVKTDTISIDLVPEKKGIFIKHSEYVVSSRKHNSTVKRRYNDFVAFHELLLIRFPYRLIPRLPPKKIVSDSHFLESRRRALQRWLTLVARHPIISSSSMLYFFLTDTSVDHQQKIKDVFKRQPDEFATSDLAEKAKDLLPADTNVQFASSREQIHNIWAGVSRLQHIFEKNVARGRALAQDADDIRNCLKEMALESHEHSQWATGGNTIWSDIKKGFSIIYKEFNSLSASALKTSIREEDTVCERLNLLADVLAAHTALCERLEKGVVSDHQRALHHMLSLKKKQIQGVIKGTDPESIDQLEAKMMQQVNVISNMELRNAFSLHCVHMETQLVHIYLELLASVFNAMVFVQIQSHTELAEVWKLIQPTVVKYLPEKSSGRQQ